MFQLYREGVQVSVLIASDFCGNQSLKNVETVNNWFADMSAVRNDLYRYKRSLQNQLLTELVTNRCNYSFVWSRRAELTFCRSVNCQTQLVITWSVLYWSRDVKDQWIISYRHFSRVNSVSRGEITHAIKTRYPLRELGSRENSGFHFYWISHNKQHER